MSLCARIAYAVRTVIRRRCPLIYRGPLKGAGVALLLLTGVELMPSIERHPVFTDVKR